MLSELCGRKLSYRTGRLKIAQLVKYHQIGMHQSVGQSSLFSGMLLLLQGIDQLDDGKEPDTVTVMLYCLHRDGGGQMCFSGTGATDKDDILRIFQKLTPV